MKRISLILALIAGALLTACVAVPVGERDHYRSDRVIVAPFLPPVVVLDVEPYYFYNDFHYRYKDNRWYYSKSRRGPWVDLPRDRYPREVRFNRQDRRQDRDSRSGRVIVAPFLPPVVVLDVEPYYFYNDFHYHYKDNRWYYSKSRRGPWVDLPRDRYPREVRFKRQDRRQDRDRSRDNRRY